MSKEITVRVDGHDQTVQYDVASLLAAPYSLSRAAVGEAEKEFMQANVSGAAREAFMDAFQTRYGPFQTLREYLDGMEDALQSPVCLYCIDGRAGWEAKLRCDECEGACHCLTTKGRRVDCPTCNEHGYVTVFEIETDINGEFLRYIGDGVRNIGKEMHQRFEIVSGGAA